LSLPDDSIRSVNEPTDEQWPRAMALVDQYQKPADDLVNELMDACRVGDSTRGSIVTATVFHARDINLLMMVLGGLSAKAVMAEQAAQKAHGPLIQPEDVGITELPPDEPWATSAMDQMRTAASLGDYETFGSTAVDSHIKALIHDRNHYGDESITLPHVVRAMMMIDQQTVSVLAAEALLRLFKLYEDQDE
jgi:hypothetical protein